MIVEAEKTLDAGYHPQLAVEIRSDDFPVYTVGRGGILNWVGTDKDRAVETVAKFKKMTALEATQEHNELLDRVRAAFTQGCKVELFEYQDRFAPTTVVVVEKHAV